jgi:hypothetical protein
MFFDTQNATLAPATWGACTLAPPSLPPLETAATRPRSPGGTSGPAGNEKALVSAEVLDSSFDVAGSLAFLLWRSVYITKQARARMAAARPRRRAAG